MHELQLIKLIILMGVFFKMTYQPQIEDSKYNLVLLNLKWMFAYICCAMSHNTCVLP